MEIKLIEEVERENRIKYEKNKGYKLCNNGYIFYHLIKHYLKVVGCSNNYIKSKVSYISFSCKNKIKFLCKKCYKSFKKESNCFLSIYDEQCYKKPIQINIKDFNYEIEYQWIWQIFFIEVFIMSLYNYWVQFVSYIIGSNAPEFLYVISFVLFIILFFGIFFKLIQKMWSF